MITIKMENGDFVTEVKQTAGGKTYNDWSIIDGIDALTQRIRNRLKLFSGEWFLDKSEGVDWFGLLEKPFSLRRLNSEIKKAILKDQEVDHIEELYLEPDFENRKLKINLSVSANSKKIQIVEEIK